MSANLQPAKMTPANKPTFAEQAKKKILPLTAFNHSTEEQGIIFPHFEGAKIRDYLLAIYQLVGGATNIVAASRVSGDGVIVFLANKELVENFQKNYGGFQFQNTFIKTRKLKTPSIKLIISKVSPTVPNIAIEDLLTKKLKLKLASPISILRVSPQDELFPHVISSRRQVYIHSNEEVPKIPNLLQLTYADRTFTVFITLDDLTCFKCGSRGHKAETCTQIVNEADDMFNNTTQVSNTDDKLNQNFPLIKQGNVELHPFISTEDPPTPPSTQPFKRGPSTLESEMSAPNMTETGIPNLANNATSESQLLNKSKRRKADLDHSKKPLTLTPSEITKISERFQLIQSTEVIKCDFSIDDFLAFIPAVRSNPNKVELAKSLTQNLGNLLYILDGIKPDMEAGTKKTISALVKRPRKSASSDLSPSDTD